MNRLFTIVLLLILAVAVISCSDPRTEAGPKPRQDCELERKRISSIATDSDIVLAKGGVSVGRATSFSRPSTFSRPTYRPSYRSSSPAIIPYRSGSSKESEKPTPKYKWVWDCD